MSTKIGARVIGLHPLLPKGTVSQKTVSQVKRTLSLEVGGENAAIPVDENARHI